MKPLRNYGEREPNFSGIICFWMNLESYVVTFLASPCLVNLHIYLDSLILRRDCCYNLIIYTLILNLIMISDEMQRYPITPALTALTVSQMEFDFQKISFQTKRPAGQNFYITFTLF